MLDNSKFLKRHKTNECSHNTRRKTTATILWLNKRCKSQGAKFLQKNKVKYLVVV